MSYTTSADVAQRLVDAWNSRKLDEFIELLAEDIEWYDPAMPDPPIRGRAAVRVFAEAVLQAFPDFTYEIQPPICSSPDGSRCAIVWRISASHLHAFLPLGYAPTGRRADIEGVDVLDLRDGQVTRILTAFDVLSAAEQLLGTRLRPSLGTWRGRFAVAVQRMLARVRKVNRTAGSSRREK